MVFPFQSATNTVAETSSESCVAPSTCITSSVFNVGKEAFLDGSVPEIPPTAHARGDRVFAEQGATTVTRVARRDPSDAASPLPVATGRTPSPGRRG